MKVLKAQEIADVTIDESFISSIVWEEDGNDIIFVLDWCGTEEMCNEIGDVKDVQLRCKFVYNLQMSIVFGKREMGMLFIKHFLCEKDGDKWRVRMTSPSSPEGVIELSCYDIEMTISNVENKI